MACPNNTFNVGGHEQKRMYRRQNTHILVMAHYETQVTLLTQPLLSRECHKISPQVAVRYVQHFLNFFLSDILFFLHNVGTLLYNLCSQECHNVQLLSSFLAFIAIHKT